MTLTLRWLAALALGAASSSALAAPAPPTNPPSATRPPPRAVEAGAATQRGRPAASRWTAATPDAMVDLWAPRARGEGPEAMAALALFDTLADRASGGRVLELLRGIGQGKGLVAEQARWLAAAYDPAPAVAPAGLVPALAVLGPFQDTSGRLNEPDIAEGDPAAWADRSASYAWGVYDVRWRDALPATVSARGLPLDLYVWPRSETCTYVASRVTLAAAGPIVVHAASTGALRLVWDGQTIAKSEELHESAIFDRLSARVEATAGDHLLAAKVCSGAPEDDGRVRLRLATPDGAPASFAASNDLGPLRGKAFAKANFKAVKTAAERALAVGPTSSPELTLWAAIVRTQGGLDDLRTPRAPGLLDAVARHGGTDADRLAMVGWVAPFGALRSGWLNSARDRAAAARDDETADFATRRLAIARLESGWSDWALAALASEPFARAKDLEAEALRARARSELGGEPGRRAELAKLAGAARAAGAKASTSSWEVIAAMARDLDPPLEVAARDELARRSPGRYDAARVRAARASGGEAVARAAAEAWRTGGLADGGEIADVARQLELAGRRPEALAFLRQGAPLAPNRAAVLGALAEALFVSPAPADRALGGPVLARARALDPGDAKKRAEAELRLGGKGEGEGKARAVGDERWMVAPETFLARAKAQPAKKGEVADRQLHWVRAVTLHDDRRVSQLIHYSREIVIAPRTQEELYEQLPVEGDESELLRARVHRAGGEVAFAEEQKSERGRPLVRWPDLKPGDVVEIALRSWTVGPIGRRGDMPFYFLDYAGAPSTHPLLYNEIVVDSPKAKPLAVDVLHGQPDRLVRTEEGARQVVRYIWDRPPQFADEPFAPKPSEIYPTLVGSTFATWDEFRAWYRGAIAGFTEPDDQVRRLAAELTKGKASRQEKLKAIFDFVADDIRYVNYVSGEWWLPNRPQQLLARRQGDCDDKAILLITLLKTVGIDATEVLIQTRYTRQPSVLLSQKAAVPLFDHGIAFLPARGGEPAVWLDATSPQSRLGPVPSMDVRTYSLFVSEGGAQMVATPKGSADDYGSQSRWTVRLGREGAADIEADERHRGDHAFNLRTHLREKDARAQWVEQNLLAGWIPQVQVDPEVDFTPELAKGEARVVYKAHSEALGRREGGDLVVSLAPLTTLTSQYAALPKRTLPVALPPQMAPSSMVHVVRLVAPAGLSPGALPPGGEEAGGEFGRASLAVARDPADPNAVVLTRTLTFDLDVVPVEKYAAWRSWLTRVDSLLHRSVRFVGAGAAPPPKRAPAPQPAAAAGAPAGAGGAP
ncbi:MAG TPA: transglutaminase domain-containing protein [Polyangiaceae bacterium]|nr:transglutaminase domain-containing protein [Polyangiaceae bacterium]